MAKRNTPLQSEDLLRIYLCLEVLRSTGEREFPMQLAVAFLWIAAHDGCRQEDLIKATSMSTGSISRNVTWLGPRHRSGKEGLKLVRREQDPDDPKRWRLYLSPKGKIFARLIEMQLKGPISDIDDETKYIKLPDEEAGEDLG